MTLRIRKRDFKPYILQWLTNKLNLGLGIGDVYYVADSSGAFYQNLLDGGVPTNEIFSTLSEAEDACTTTQNDVVCMTPGAYLETAEIAWDKPHTHIVGFGGLNQLGDYSEPSVVVYSTTITVANILNITGQNCQFHDVNVQNAGANAACLSAVKLDKYGCYFKNVRIAGCMAATQAATALACSLWIRGAGMYPIFDNCVIGHDVWTTRSGANQGVILFNESNTQVNGGLFRNCQLLSVCETATGAFVSVVGNNVLGRGWVFDNCIFNNYTTGTKMNQAFYQSASNSIYDRAVLLKDCILNTKGCDAWQDSDYGNIYGNQPASASAGGLVTEVSE